MKRRQALVAACRAAGCATALPWLALPAAATPTPPGQVVAWPEVALLDGSRWGQAQAAGQAVVVVFWSTTCPFCRRHNQHVQKLVQAAAGLPLAVLGVARDRDAEAVRRYAAQQGYSFAITLQHAPLAAVLTARSVIPLTATVDRQGRLKHVIPGEMFEEDVMELLKLARSPDRT
jgi:thiol-disulfide isomerase/thioredoxin